MSVDPYTLARRRHALLRGALCWLLAGAAALLLTPLHAWTPLLGWGPMLALVVSPVLVLLALTPRLPMRKRAMHQRRRVR